MKQKKKKELKEAESESNHIVKGETKRIQGDGKNEWKKKQVRTCEKVKEDV